MNTYPEISKLAYALYKQEWLDTHYTREMMLDTRRNYAEYILECKREGIDALPFDAWWWDGGVDYSYACYDEFIGAEYLDEKYMEELLSSPELIEAYQTDRRASDTRKTWWVTYRIDARYVAEVKGDTIKDALAEAESEYAGADFGAAQDIDGDAIIVEDENGNYVWEKD